MKRIYYIEFRAMGCQVTAQLETETHDQSILQALPASVEKIEACLSRFRPHSELMALNAQAGQWISVSDVLFENICTAKHAARLTNGLYNPLVLPAMLANGYDRSFEQINSPTLSPPIPAADWRSIQLRMNTHEVQLIAGSALDLGGIAKGWTAAKLATDLSIYGACLINMGGDIVAHGAPEGLSGWDVDIMDPATDSTFATILMRDAAIATSGIDFRRWKTNAGQIRHHIIDPRTGQSVQSDAVSAGVIHKYAPTAEAYAKAALLLGTDEGLNWLNQQWDTAAVMFRDDGAVVSTTNFSQLIIEGINL